MADMKSELEKRARANAVAEKQRLTCELEERVRKKLHGEPAGHAQPHAHHGAHEDHGHDGGLHAAEHQLEHRVKEKAGLSTVEHVLDHAIETVGERIMEHAAGATGERLAEGLLERTAEATSSRLLERAAEATGERLMERAAEATGERLLERAAEVTGERLLESAGERILERGVGSTLRAASASEYMLARSVAAGEHAAGSAAERTMKTASEQIIGAVGEHVAESVGERVAESVGERVAESVGERVAESMGERVAESVGERIAESIGERVAESVGERVVVKPTMVVANVTVATVQESASKSSWLLPVMQTIRNVVPVVGTGFVAYMAREDIKRVRREWQVRRSLISPVIFFVLAAMGDVMDLLVHATVVMGIFFIHIDHHLLHSVERLGWIAAIVATLSMIIGEIVSGHLPAPDHSVAAHHKKTQ